jgi:uncharacterized membrane protein
VAALLVAGATFLAASVEWVEALTIVLAVGLFRSWRSALVGTLAAAVVLAVLVGGLGAALSAYVPIGLVRTVVGVFLLLFGLRWLHKAVLRSAGLKALHDEAESFQETRRHLLAGGAAVSTELDWAGVATAFNGVLLEGLEVVFIVLALGGLHNLDAALAGAAAAIVAVVGLGIVVRQPLTRVPENRMKFVVGVMLTAFGTFFAGEGLGVVWWHDDLVLLPLIALYLAAALLLVLWMRRPSRVRGAEPGAVRVLRTAVEEVWGLLVDNGSLAVLTVALLLGIGLFVAKTGQGRAAAVLLVAGILAAVTLTLNGERRPAQAAAASEPSPATETSPGVTGAVPAPRLE